MKMVCFPRFRHWRTGQWVYPKTAKVFCVMVDDDGKKIPGTFGEGPCDPPTAGDADQV
jgi:hypothetical protein